MADVVIAPDKFKGSLSAAEVARHLAIGFEKAGLAVACVPVADGGDGTVAAMVTAGYPARTTAVTGPLGERRHARWARGSGSATEAAGTCETRGASHATGAAGFRNAAGIPEAGRPNGEARTTRSAAGLGSAPGRSSQNPGATGPLAIVELAQASGLVVSPRPLDALHATSLGTGELLRTARDSGCRRIVLGVGGSACTDGGAGMLQALGVGLRDAHGRDLPPGGAALRDLRSVDAGAVRDWRAVDLTVACDVDSPLLGPGGAAAVYGPQKGASATEVATLEAGLSNFAAIVRRDLGVDMAATPGAGAAGGVAYGALAFLGAKLRSGIDLVLDLVGFEKRLAGAALVVTGEGRLDAQTIRGKAPAGVAAAAARAEVPTVAVAGVCELDDAALATAGFAAAYRLSDLEPDPAVSIREAAPLLERLALRIAADHLPAEGWPR